MILIKCDNLMKDCMFEEIPPKHETDVAKVYRDAGRRIPIQLNGVMGNLGKRNSKDIVLGTNNNIV